MGVGGVVVMVVMCVVVMVMVMVIMIVVVIMVVVMVVVHIEAAGAGAEGVAERAVGNVGAGGARALAFDMVVVAFLQAADLGLEAQHGGAVFAHDAGRGRGVAEGGMSGAGGGGDLDRFAVFQREDLGAVGAGAAIGGRG